MQAPPPPRRRPPMAERTPTPFSSAPRPATTGRQNACASGWLRGVPSQRSKARNLTDGAGIAAPRSMPRQLASDALLAGDRNSAPGRGAQSRSRRTARYEPCSLPGRFVVPNERGEAGTAVTRRRDGDFLTCARFREFGGRLGGRRIVTAGRIFFSSPCAPLPSLRRASSPAFGPGTPFCG